MQVANAPPTDISVGLGGPERILTSFEFYLSLEVLAFGLIVVLLEYFLLRRHSISSEELLRIYAVTLIIIGTLFAITAGFGNLQIAPAMGLFGTIAGYLLGRRDRTPNAMPDGNAHHDAATRAVEESQK
jgi:Kef-type K+ transport system membrane component KefB